MNKKVSAEPLDLFDKIFEKIDRQTEIQTQINQTFKEYDYIIQLREFLVQLKIALNQLNQTIADVKLNDKSDKESTMQAYSEMKFHYFGIFSTQLAFENYIYCESKKLKATDDFHSVIDTWKRRPEVRLVKAIRNRIQHGAMLDGSLRIEMKTRHESQSVLVFYVLDESIWKRVLKCVDRDTKEFFTNSVKPNKDRLHFLVSRYDESLRSLVELIERQFIQIYSVDLADRQALLGELDKIKEWFATKGWSDL